MRARVAIGSGMLALHSACVINPAFDQQDASTSGEVSTTASSEGTATTTTTASTSDPASSDGSDGAAVCGNGIVEGDEPCDDGDDEDGDGCNVGCVLSGAQLWEIRKDGGSGGWDATHDLAVLPDDSVVLAGIGTVDGLQAELVRVDVNGNELWSHLHSVEGAIDSDAWGAARLNDGAIVAGTGDNDVMFVRALDPDGVELWTYEGPGRVYDASSDGSDEIWIAGRHPEGAAAFWHLDGSGALVAVHDEASGSLPADSVVWGIATGANGRVAGAGQLEAEARAWVRELYGGSGGVAWETDVTALAADSDAGYGVTIAIGGAVAMVGDLVFGEERHGWLLRRATDGEMLPPIEQEELGNYHGVAIGPTGEIAVSGWVDNGLGKIALVVKYAPDGTLAWRKEITGDVVVGENKAWTVGIRSDAVIVAAGELVEDATMLDRWVVAFAP